MKTTALSGLVLMIAAMFVTVQFGAVTAFARPDTNTTSSKVKKTKSHYHMMKLPGLTAPAHSRARQKARKEAKKAEKEALNRQHFLGTIAKKNGHYVMTAGILTFKLNDQAQVRKYAGKTVNITGKLNPYQNRINVQNIKTASA